MLRTNRTSHDSARPAGWLTLVGAFVFACLLLVLSHSALPDASADHAHGLGPTVAGWTEATSDNRDRPCPSQSHAGQPSACVSSGVPLAMPDTRGTLQAPIAQPARIASPYDVEVLPQCCGRPPDRPPRFAA